MYIHEVISEGKKNTQQVASVSAYVFVGTSVRAALGINQKFRTCCIIRLCASACRISLRISGSMHSIHELKPHDMNLPACRHQLQQLAGPAISCCVLQCVAKCCNLLYKLLASCVERERKGDSETDPARVLPP
jgi:hypothetical protein